MTFVALRIQHRDRDVFFTLERARGRRTGRETRYLGRLPRIPAALRQAFGEIRNSWAWALDLSPVDQDELRRDLLSRRDRKAGRRETIAKLRRRFA